MRSRRVPILLASAAALVGAVDASAQCSTSGTGVTCSGSPGPVAYTQDWTSLTIRDLTAFITQPDFALPAVLLSSTAAGGGQNQRGQDAATLALSFAGAPYGVTSQGGGLTTFSSAGNGGVGKEEDAGGGGGTGGGVTLTFTGGTVVTPSADGGVALFAQSSGGAGGASSYLHKYFFNGHGGAGGAGGNGGAVNVVVTQGTFKQQAQAFGTLFAASLGGVGGAGAQTEATGGAAYGGAGGGGGAAGAVTLAFGAVTVAMTAQGGGAAVLAQSFGGAGGAGAEGYSDVADAHGGNGGAGGAGGAITITAGGSASPGTLAIATTAPRQHAIEATSTGGAGGTGGFGHANTIKGFGGDGGVGGTGGTVAIQLAGASLATTGYKSLGVFARSYGGAGGTGGEGKGGSGHGGADLGGGPGGDVTVGFSGTIATAGYESNALFAQSVGGFSGAGGSASGFVAYGAGDQSAGNGGNVGITVTGATSTITTGGDDAVGVKAQSVGGGGGTASATAGVAALGGTGAAGGSGGIVTVQNEAAVTTGGEHAAALMAESQGGGGGDAGSARGVVAIGGASGPGGSGGQATVVNGASGTLRTSGQRSDGIVAASVGGGGGTAYSTSGVVAIGGTGGGGGTGGTAAVQNDASITTTGQDADGVFVHSVGGGGGAAANAIGVSALFSLAIGGAGGAGGSAADASYADSGTGGYTIRTSGERARGVLVLSVGGGGGDAGNAISVSGIPVLDVAIGRGGAGGGGGAAGSASVSLSGDVGTAGGNADAIHAAAIGGGGGHAGTTVAASQGGALAVSVALGGAGGNGGGGGEVNVVATGALTTTGDVAAGVRAQSVGGGGGHAGTTVGGATVSVLSVTTTLGGSGGAGGAGSSVQVATDGPIATAGASSYGIAATSTGGGGGSAALAGSVNGASAVNIATTIGGSGGGGGDGGGVQVTAADAIATQGHNAAAIAAMSVGGGGGDGGVTFAANGVSGGNVGITVGGNGGTGGHAPATSTGNGGNVTVDNSGVITTVGDVAEGIRAHSIANGGGTSGLVVDASAASLGALDVAVGGRGGPGGASGLVTVTNEGSIATQGAYATAVDAKSIAGGGGNAKGTITTSGVTMGSLNSAVGGNGGAGGTAGAVSVAATGSAKTGGDFAHGLVAQSVGGAGGEGGLAVEAGLNVGEVEGSLNVSVGGSGGTGGTGGAVTVNASGTIATGGFGAYGISAQSIGGNGGLAGTVYSGNAAASSTGSLQMTGTWGGIGGSGAVGGAVQVTNGANVSTQGYLSTALLAQSIGGGGGAGGGVYTVGATATPGSSLTFAANHGGVGGSGNDAGTVTVVNTGMLSTAAAGSAALIAESIGGGGGNGGNAGAIVVTLTGGGAGNTLSSNINLGAGGAGGVGGSGDTVTVTNRGAITTTGDLSRGIEAESIGGGGGNGGAASAYSYSFNGACSVLSGSDGSYLCQASDGTSSKVKINGKIEIGGSGGAAGNGGEVKIDNQAAISTAGAVAHAIYAKSVGGGGGHGGEGGTGLNAWTTNKLANEITSLFKDATSIPGFTSVNIIVGGAGGASGDGGDVQVASSAPLITGGDHAFGVHAQSVGGGGGDGGAASEGLSGKIGISGTGSGGGTGGSVTVSTQGALRTGGYGSVGIFAQSVGGGGGTAGNLEKAIAYSWLDLNIGMGVVNVQQDAGAGGAGGAVSVTAGPIATTGVYAHGIVAQSVGGSGGMAGLKSGIDEANHAYDIAGSGGAAGNGGAVSVTVNGAIDVGGLWAHGVFAQSVSGLGKDDKAGDVTIDVDANVTATGSNGRAILAQSQGKTQSGDIAITIAKGVTVATGAAGDVTVGLKDGNRNTVTNYGTITQGNAASYAIRAEGATVGTLVDNHGTINGSMLGTAMAPGNPAAAFASASSIAVHNQPGAVINAGSLLDVAALANHGTLAVGGAQKVGATHVTGDLVQGASGVLAIDVDPRSGGTADRLVVDGHAELAGRIAVNLIDPWQSTAGPHTLPIVAAGGGVTLGALTPSRSAVAQFALRSPGAGELALAYDIDFANAGILARANANQDAVARHLHALYRAGALDAATARSLIAIEDSGTFAEALATLGTEVAVDNQLATLLAAANFNQALVNCSERPGEAQLGGGTRCGFAGVRGSRLRQQTTGDSTGFGADDWTLTAGGQTDVAPGWSLGGALAFGQRDLDVTDGNATSRGETYDGGVVALRRDGAWQWSGALALGYGTFDNQRAPLGGAAAAATQRLWRVSGQVQAAWLAQGARWALRPRVALGVHYLAMQGFSEGGTNAFRVAVDAQRDTYVDVVPAVDLYTDSETADGVRVRPQVTVGVTQFMGGAAPSATARFASAPPTVPAFTASTGLDRTRLDAAASVTMFATRDVTVQAEAFGSFSAHTERYGAGLRAVLAF